MNSGSIQEAKENPLHAIKHNALSVLMIGTEANVFREGSAARARIAEYGLLVRELRIIVLNSGVKYEQTTFENISVYPTNSACAFLAPLKALFIGFHIASVDIVTAQDPFESGVVAFLLSRIGRARLQIQIHTDFLNPHFTRQSFIHYIRVLIARIILPRATCIRVVSARIFDSLRRVDPRLLSRTVILPIFVDVAHFETASKSHELRDCYREFDKLVLMVGRFEFEKDFSMGLRVFRTILTEFPHAGLIIVGKGRLEKALRAEVKAYGLDEHIVFVPWQRDLAVWYKTADVLLVTSRYEGYGTAMVEALAAGIPVVSRDVGIAAEAGAYVVDEDSHLAFVLAAVLRGEWRGRGLLHRPYPTKAHYLKLFQESLQKCGTT